MNTYFEKWSEVVLTASLVLVSILPALSFPQIANATAGNYSIDGSATPNGLTVDVIGQAAANPFTGQEDDQHVSIDWNEDNSATPSNANGDWETVLDILGDEAGFFASTTWNGSHTYPAPGLYTIFVRVHHAQPGGAESGSGQISFEVELEPQCSDGTDNDGDSLTDYPADPGCTDAEDDDEFNPPPPVLGCTDPDATNFDPLATQDDGSCIFPVLGCTDPDATNFDPLATQDDGSCVYPIPGCMDPEALNYNPNATEDDGSCTYPVLGCTNPNATNYNPLATPGNADADECIFPVLGCTDPEANNYNPAATEDDDSCTYDPAPTDTTPPASQFDNNRNYEIIETELLALSLTGTSTDDFPGIKSGVDSAELKIFKIADDTVIQSSNFNEQFEQMSCSNSEGQIPIEIVALSLVSIDPLPLNTTWSHNWTPSKGVYCFEVHAKDKVGNEEHTAIAGPFAYTFTPPVPPPAPPSTPPSGGGGSSRSGDFRNSGQVLGASTGQVLGESCGLYMDRFIRSGRINDVEQVKKLQTFLNKWMNANLPVTGFYGSLTLQAVNAFQEKYASEVLTPWNLTGPTGITYLTTLRWINMLECPELALQVPNLVEWSRNPNVPPILPSPLATTPTIPDVNVPEQTNDESISESLPASAVGADEASGGFWNFLKGLFGK